MPRSRVLSFMTEWSSRNQENNASDSRLTKAQPEPSQTPPRKQPSDIDTITPQSIGNTLDSLAKSSNVPQSPTTTPSRARGDSRASVRPNSMIQTYNPPQVDVAQDTPPELQPIFSFLNSHSNKLYQEGYFLKLHDLDSRGRPSGDRTWAECFAQLVGTVLSLWDAAALDVAGEDGEVVPTFINLSDASIKMIESLPMSGAQGGSLQNVLSISTAANNRYLLHFNSYSSLTQWTAGIRLAMFEHATLQEAYTGSLIAGKGRFLNNIKNIMERSRFAHDDWARVRFGAGTPWKRCWCVISPPDEKEFAKAQKNLKKSAYDRSVKVPKGDIKFYDTRKVTKKTRPIATITDAYAAYAIYPQSKPLIDQSTLVKLEGLVTIHTAPETTTEGFVFVMPEVHPAVSGFEMLLRWLFPVYDTFGLYGRPTRLIADTLDQRGLMFAMPKERRYGYLDILDVSSLIHTAGSPAWSERQWRREMKKLTSDRMLAQADNGPSSLRQMSQRRNTTSRTSLPGNRGGIRFDDGGSPSSTPVSREASPLPRNPDFGPPRRTDSAPPTQGSPSPHKRSASDAPYRRHMAEIPSRLSYETSRPADDAPPPAPPKHGGALGSTQGRPMGPGSLERIQSEAEVPTISTTYDEVGGQTASPNNLQPIVPVASPPAFQHNPGSHPANRPAVPPELRRAHSNVDAATLYQMEEAARGDRTPEEDYENGRTNEQGNRVVYTNLAHRNGTADRSQGMVSNSSKPQYPHEPAQSPGTLGGSPYGAQWGKSQTDIPQEQGRSPQAFEERRRPAPPQTMSSSKSISRKPVPARAQELPREASPPQPQPVPQSSDDASSDYHADSLEGGFFDPDVLDRVLSGDGDRASTMQSAASTQPDYASTVSSHKGPRESVERPRAGKLKTVGNPDMPAEHIRVGKLDNWREEQKAQETGLPSIDFGPTYAYKPSSRPGTSGTMMPGDTGDRSRSRSRDRLRGSGRVTPSGIVPNDNRRHSYFGDLTSARPGSTSPNEDPLNQAGNRHSIAWTPGRSSPQPPQRSTLTPEQWVQYRSALASQPQYAPPRKPTPTKEHDRVGSSGSANLQQNRRSATKTPEPMSRAASADWSKQQERGKRTPEPLARASSADWSKHLEQRQKTPEPLSRTASGDWSKHVEREQRTPPSRPHSRGANVYLNQQATLINSHSNTLSAKEQMHVARATGTPMLDMAAKATNKPSPDSQNVGLVGAIGAREREKAAMKAGNRNSMAVENAIRARQQQQAQLEAEAQMQAQTQAYQYQYQQQRAYAQSTMGGQGMMGGAPSMMAGQGMMGGAPSMMGSPGMMSGAPSVMGMSQAPSQYFPPPQQQQPQTRPGLQQQNRSSFYGASSPGLYQQQQQAPPPPQQQFGYGSTYGQMLQQQQAQQMQAQGGNRQSWYGGGYVGGQQPPPPGGQGQWHGRR